MDNFFFADPFKFDGKEAKTNTRSALIASRKKKVELLETGIGRNNVRFGDQEEI